MNFRAPLITALLWAALQACVIPVAQAADTAIPCSKPWSLKGTPFNSVFTRYNGPVSTCLPLDAPRNVRLVMPNGEVRNTYGYIPVTCGEDGICALGNEFYGNAPAGHYIVASGWYMGTDTTGQPVSYARGTGPAFNGKPYVANPNIKREPGEKFHVACPVNDSAYCFVDTDMGLITVKMESLPTIGIPTVKAEEVEAKGGSCQSIPMCYDKDGKQIGLDPEFLK
ncbi:MULTISPECIES: hypothetical protein [unclassified Pseudomonas]|jgi:hypothetical protein|uniref:hypothetical protein n=1 Tax=unclassified Pseudomonas TaxID=196821 RepID=UPI000A5E7017|nr:MULTISPECIES: hypothetical protein [unclassified Pseudomonas]